MAHHFRHRRIAADTDSGHGADAAADVSRTPASRRFRSGTDFTLSPSRRPVALCAANHGGEAVALKGEPDDDGAVRIHGNWLRWRIPVTSPVCRCHMFKHGIVRCDCRPLQMEDIDRLLRCDPTVVFRACHIRTLLYGSSASSGKVKPSNRQCRPLIRATWQRLYECVANVLTY
jgi:hypothetical protein